MSEDLIRRSDAISALGEEPDVWFDDDGYEHGLRDQWRCDVNAINAVPSAQQWIPVTERLPEPYSGEYFVTINDGSVYTDVLWFDSPGDGRYESCFYKTDDDGYGVVCDDVIAWMPLPKPWEGDEA